jgi:hypothetical protein
MAGGGEFGKRASGYQKRGVFELSWDGLQACAEVWFAGRGKIFTIRWAI